jgi:hypothetical protein
MSQSSSAKELYNQISRRRSRSIAGSNFRSLSNIPHCWLINKPGPFFNSSVTDHPHRSIKDRKLGELLIHQRPNPTKAHLSANLIFGYIKFIRPNLFKFNNASNFRYNFSNLKGRFLRFTHPSATKNFV